MTPRYKSDSNSRELKVCKLLPFESATQHRNRMRLRSTELQVLSGPVLGGSSNSSSKFSAIHSDNFWGRNCSRGWLFRKAYSKLCSCLFDAPEAVKACAFRSKTSRLGARIAPCKRDVNHTYTFTYTHLCSCYIQYMLHICHEYGSLYFYELTAMRRFRSPRFSIALRVG